jgi:predicted transcriptional regulator with HTH domain
MLISFLDVVANFINRAMKMTYQRRKILEYLKRRYPKPTKYKHMKHIATPDILSRQFKVFRQLGLIEVEQTKDGRIYKILGENT